MLVDGSVGSPYVGEVKSNALVRSPVTARRQALMFGQVAGLPIAVVHFSRNWITDVWSNTSELTQPPRDHGETTTIGTRKPRPMAVPLTNSSVVPAGGDGGCTWSKKPSFSS